MAIWKIVEDCIFQRWLLPHLPSYMLFKNIVIHHWGLGSLCSFSFQLGRFGRMFHLMEFGEDDIIWLSRIDNKSQCNFHMAFWDTCFWILSCHVISLIIWRPPWYKEAKSCTEFMCKHELWLTVSIWVLPVQVWYVWVNVPLYYFISQQMSDP